MRAAPAPRVWSPGGFRRSRASVVVLAGLLFAAPGVASDDETADDNPWVSGPEVPVEDEALRNPSPPRESDGAREPLNPAPPAPDPFVVRPPPSPPPDEDLRFSTVLHDEELRAFGDLSLADPLVVVPGLRFDPALTRGERPSLRGLEQGHLDVRLDGVPLATSSTWPDFPLFGLFVPDDVLRVVVRHGPRASGIGSTTGAAGVLELETVPPPVELGEGVPLTGRVRAGYGGPDLEKALLARGATGFGRVRVGLTAGAYHAEDLALGRDAGLLAASDVLGGHLGARVDVTPFAGLRTFAAWRSARQGDNPYPSLCLEDDAGDRPDCTRVIDRALDLLYAGVDGGGTILGWRLDARARAHAQHLGEKTERHGAAVVSTEVAEDFSYRAGALADLWLTPPPVALGDALALATRLGLHGELLRDRVLSRHMSRSRRLADAEPSDAFREDPSRASRVDDALLDSAALGVSARAGLSFLRAELGVRVVGERMEAPEGARLPEGLDDDSVSVEAELALRAQVLESLSLFGALTRSERGDLLAARTLGPRRLRHSPAPALSGGSRFLEHGVELGVDHALSWLHTEAVVYATRRTGALTSGIDPRDERGVERVVLGPARTALGVEGRVRYRTFVDGLTGLATLGLLAVDEGELFGEVPSAPASAVPPPFGVLVLDYRPSSSWFGAYTRLRYALPQARLSPVEAKDPMLCPESQQDPQVLPCRGSAGVGLFDLGARFSPSEQLAIDALIENLLDAPWRSFGHELPGGGLGARVTVTLSL